MSTEEQKRFSGPRRGQLLFAIGFLVISVLLLSQIGDQTKWVKKTKFAAQPRFWPAVGLIGMVLFTSLHLYKLPWKRIYHDDYREVWAWGQSIEYAGWFLAYVFLAPIIGYLPATMLFMPAMTWRMGYRSKKMIWISVGFAAAVVVLFKSVLEVRIPGGLIYEYLPGALRSFFILNF